MSADSYHSPCALQHCVRGITLMFSDFAVGAPYDGPNHQGAVYIFLGSRDGVMKKPSQVGIMILQNNRTPIPWRCPST